MTTKKRIGYEPTISKPWYVFAETGEAHVELRGANAPSDAWIPTGHELGRYATLAEAKQAHPDAALGSSAIGAKTAGCR